MGLFSTIRDALGLTLPPQVGPPPPWTIHPRAQRALARLSDNSVALRRSTVDGALQLAIIDRADAAVVLHDLTSDQVAGLCLEHTGGEFVIGCQLQVSPSETPNPDVRVYACSWPLIDDGSLHAEPGHTPGLTKPLVELTGVASLLVRDNIVSIERQRDMSWSALDRAVPEALRAWFASGGGLLCASDARSERSTEFNEVQRVMNDTVLPYVHSHGGDIRLIDVSDGIVKVKLIGACATCPASMLTLKGGVQRQLREQLPDIVERVEAVD